MGLDLYCGDHHVCMGYYSGVQRMWKDLVILVTRLCDLQIQRIESRESLDIKEVAAWNGAKQMIALWTDTTLGWACDERDSQEAIVI
jgi:hypothetical protein